MKGKTAVYVLFRSGKRTAASIIAPADRDRVRAEIQTAIKATYTALSRAIGPWPSRATCCNTNT